MRITPAYAGKSTPATVWAPSSKDHPRVCGEKKRNNRQHRCTGDHPRVCGEKCAARHDLTCCLGSPRVCGKRFARPLVPPMVQDHPAYAGKAPAHVMLSVSSRITPRMREKQIADQWATRIEGSPRVCGEKFPLAVSDVLHRDHPAYAGKRLKRSRSTVPPVAIVPLFPSVCNKPVVSDGSPAGRDAPLFLPAENAVPASPAYNLRSL